MNSVSPSAEPPLRVSTARSSPTEPNEGNPGEQLRLFELDLDDGQRLRALRPLLEEHGDGIVEGFYAHLLTFPDLATLLRGAPGRLEHLAGLQRSYLVSMTDGRFDDQYFAGRLRVGKVHQELGVRPDWYIAGLSRLLRLTLRRVLGRHGEAAAALPTVEALIKSVFCDIALAMRTYIYGGYVRREVALEMEDAARVAQEALTLHAETERLKDDLTRMIVHDLKNPVHGIAMMVQLALRKSTDLSTTHRTYFKQIERTCREMMRLIQNLLEIAKIEEGKMPIECVAVVLAELADEIVAEYGPVAEEAGRTLALRVPVTLPALAADRALLRRALSNLVVNALRHSGSPVVHLSAAATDDGRGVEIAVTDHGRGIPPDQQARMFEKFSSVRRSAVEDPTTDTGLGLPFCRLVVERMGGTITVHSAPGNETRFTIILPVWDAHAVP